MKINVVGNRNSLVAALLLLFILTSQCLAQEQNRFLLAASTSTFGYGPLWVADKRGFFTRNGLDVRSVLVRGTGIAIQALVGGSVQAAVAAADAPIGGIDNGLDLVMVASMSNAASHMIIGGKNYRRYEDLRGTTVGANSVTSGTAFLLRRVLKAKGLEFGKDYRLINVGGTSSALLALSSGQVSATIVGIPAAYMTSEAGFNIIGKVVDLIPQYLNSAVTVKRSWAENNRPTMVRFLKGYVEARVWLYKNKEAAVEFLSKELQLSRDHARKGWEYFVENQVWPQDARISMEALQTVADIYAEQMQAKAPLSRSEKYVDQSYLEQALREIGIR
jgi:ABC-type nitrate/sulfonate/bicarbonate transport system substrate-binding protein